MGDAEEIAQNKTGIPFLTEIGPGAQLLAQLLQETATVMKYSLIVVASVPMLILYPFIQKFFVTGVMIGSVKG